MQRFTCDICGKPLEQHGHRYVMRIDEVPRSYSTWYKSWDLCPACAERLVEQLNEKGKRCTTT